MAGIVDVAAGIIWRGGLAASGEEFLAVDRPQGKPLAGYYEFPGGKCEPGEDPEQALVRELEEELGIRVTAQRPYKVMLHTYPHATVRLHFFHVLGFEGTPRPHEGQRMCWVTPAQAASLGFLPVDLEILAELARLCETQGARDGV